MRKIFPPFVIVLLSACSLVPEHSSPPLGPVTDRWLNSSAVSDAEAVPSGEWWRIFGQPQLNELQSRALSGNPDLASAMARISQARAQVVIAGVPLLPQLGASAGKQFANRFGSKDSQHSSSLALNASYELDFWGRNDAAAKSARSLLEATQFERETVGLTLTGSLASTWLEAIALADRLAVTRRNLDLSRRTLEIARARAAAGRLSPLDVAQQQYEVASIEAQISNLEQQRSQVLNRLATLVGIPPVDLPPITGSLANIPVPVVNAQLPSIVLARRPDIRASEAAMAAANADIGVARAALYPSISLAAGITGPSDALWTLGANIVQTIFDNGARKAGILQSEARYEELVANYRKTILAALQDVENNLAAIRFSAEEELAQQKAVAAAQQTRQLAEIRYREGAIDSLVLIQAQRNLLQADDAVLQAKLAQLHAAIGLSKAVAGRFDPN